MPEEQGQTPCDKSQAVGLDLDRFDSAQEIGFLNREVFDLIRPTITAKVVITGPILKKNRARHPEVDKYYDEVPDMLKNPFVVAKNKKDSDVAVIYERLTQEGKRRYLRAAVYLKRSSDGPGKFNTLLSLRYAREGELLRDKKAGRIVYERV